MAALSSLDDIKRDLEFATEQLKNVDSYIKRITGRDPLNDSRVNNLGNALNRATDRNPDEDIQVSIASSVVRVSDAPSRLEALKNLKHSDKERGRRMLNVLQGTLKQFQSESKSATLKPQMEKRRLIDDRLDKRFMKEKEALRLERTELFRTRREQNSEVILLKQKMRIIKEFELWKEEQEKMKGFCRTSNSPHIFFRPKIDNDDSRWLIELTSRDIDNLITQRRDKLEYVLKDVMKARHNFFATSTTTLKANSQSVFDRIYDPDAMDDKESWLPDMAKQLSSHVVTKITSNEHDEPEQRDHPKGNNPVKSTFVPVVMEDEPMRTHSSNRDLEAGELSDTSETFGIGVDEPQLMEGGEHDDDEDDESKNQSLYSLNNGSQQQQLDNKLSTHPDEVITLIQPTTFVNV